MADHTWMTGVHHELCMLSNQRCADQREQFLLLYLTLIRQHVLFFKLYKRLLQSMLQTVKGYREKLDTYNVYAKDLFSSLLKDLDTLIAWLQEEHKVFEKTITVEEKQLSTRKAELRDTINFKRLTYFKRQYIDTLITSMVAKEEGTLLHDRIESFMDYEKTLHTLLNDLEKSHQITTTALDEQKKTVRLVKTADQKKKLIALEKEYATEQTLIDLIHTKLQELHLSNKELPDIEKKYNNVAKDEQ